MTITERTRKESFEKIQSNKESICNNIIKILKNETDAVQNIGLTAREISNRLYLKGLVKDDSRQSSQPRLTELVDAGRVVVIGKKYDLYSDRNVASYAIKV